MIKRIFCLLLFFMQLREGKSQQQIPENDFILSPNAVRSSFFDHYISGMTLDNAGFLWIGTNKGLLRYDGIELKKFPLDTSSRFNTSNDVTNVMRTRKEGAVFARVKSGDLYIIKNGVPLLYDTTLRTNYYSAVQVFGSFPSVEVIKAFNKVRKELTATYHLSFKKGNIMAVDDSRFLVVDEDHSALYLFTGSSTTGKRIPLESPFESFINLGSRFFILTEKMDSYEFIPASGSLVKIKNDLGTPGIRHSSGNMHFYCDYSVGRSFYTQDNRLYELSLNKEKDALQKNYMTQIKGQRHPFLQVVVDTVSGAHFFASKLAGFYTGEYTRLRSHPIPLALTQHYKDPSYIIPYTVQKINDSTVLTPNGTFLTIGSNGTATQRVVESFIGNRYSLAMLPGNDIVSAAPGGALKRYFAKTGYRSGSSYTLTPFQTVDDSQVILMKAESDSLWVCTHKGIYIVKPGKITQVFDHSKKNNDGVFFEMKLFERMDAGTIFMSNQFGLFRLHTSYPYKIDTIQPGSLVYVRHVLKTSNMLLLCSYKKGLFLYKDGKYLSVPLYKRQDELKLCHNSFLDEEGMLWITTDKGLFKTTLASLVNSTRPDAPPPLFLKYGGIVDRTENIEFNGGGLPAYAMLRDHTLVYPAINGMVSFNYKRLDEKVHFSSNSFVYTLRTSINHVPVKPARDSFRLSSDVNQLYIETSIPYFGNVENVILEYKYDSGWVEFPYEDEHEMISVKPKPGYSHFWLRVRNGYGTNDYAVKKLTIFRAYKLSERLWFYPFLLAVLLLGIFIIVRVNSRRISRINRKLEQKVDSKTAELKSMVETKNLLLGIISHDMISPLRHIAMLSNLVVKKEQLDTGEMRDVLSTIRHTCEKLHMEFTGVVSWIKHASEAIQPEKEDCNLHEMVENSVNTYMSPESVRKISLINAIDKNTIVWADPKLLSPIINNIISNAIKNTYEGEIRIYNLPVSGQPAKTTLVIKDTGIGFKPEALEKARKIFAGEYPPAYHNYGSGLGFFMIAELSKLHDIDVTLESKRGEGTSVTLVI